MRFAKTISFTLPPDLLQMAQETAQREHRTMSELLREALRQYMMENRSAQLASWNALLERTRAHGKAIGITREEDVQRLSDELRRTKRTQHEKHAS